MLYSSANAAAPASNADWDSMLPEGPATDDWLFNSSEAIDFAAEEEGLNNAPVVFWAFSVAGTPATSQLLQVSGRFWATSGDRQRLRYHRRLVEVLKHSSVALPAPATTVSQGFLDALLEFAPHELGMSLVVDEDREASLVLTAYWPTGTLHVEHFFHFPADDPDDTVVNFYANPTSSAVAPAREWGWYCPAHEFWQRLRFQLRNGLYPLERGW